MGYKKWCLIYNSKITMGTHSSQVEKGIYYCIVLNNGPKCCLFVPYRCLSLQNRVHLHAPVCMLIECVIHFANYVFVNSLMSRYACTCVDELSRCGPDNGMTPVRHQAIV